MQTGLRSLVNQSEWESLFLFIAQPWCTKQLATPFYFVQLAKPWCVLHFQASQAINEFQFATTKVTLKVEEQSKNDPVFEESRYSGFVSNVGSMVVETSGENMPLRIQATDADFANVK